MKRRGSSHPDEAPLDDLAAYEREAEAVLAHMQTASLGDAARALAAFDARLRSTVPRARALVMDSHREAVPPPTNANRPRCGARCRSRDGAPCRAPVVIDRLANGTVRVRKRCRMHGGLSTGPRTEEGRRRCAEAARRRWERSR